MKTPGCATVQDTRNQSCIHPQCSNVLMAYFKTSACEREYFWCFSGTVKNQPEKLAAGWEEGAVPVAVMSCPRAGGCHGCRGWGADRQGRGGCGDALHMLPVV